MSYYLLPKNHNLLNVNPQYDNDECKIYSSYSLYNFYNTIKTEIDMLCSKENDIKINNYDELIKIVHPYEYIFFKVKIFV